MTQVTSDAPRRGVVALLRCTFNTLLVSRNRGQNAHDNQRVTTYSSLIIEESAESAP